MEEAAGNFGVKYVGEVCHGRYDVHEMLNLVNGWVLYLVQSVCVGAHDARIANEQIDETLTTLDFFNKMMDRHFVCDFAYHGDDLSSTLFGIQPV